MKFRRPLREVVSWNNKHVSYNASYVVDLFVRSWVEIKMLQVLTRLKLSTSSWGRELKCKKSFSPVVYSASTSSWGRELKYQWNHHENGFHERRPLREVVSWNTIIEECYDFDSSRPLREVVSWNTSKQRVAIQQDSLPLREVVSWNTKKMAGCQHIKVDLFVRSWVEISK